jgi:UDP-N-acetylmuramoyl-tripeptide--D-alanyl-D-alanine ligase
VSFSEQIIRSRSIVERHCVQLVNPYPAITLFFSVSDRKERAHVVHVSGESFDAVWNQGIVKLRRLLDKHKLKEGWLRVDWVTHVDALNWDELNKRLQGTKRNYFRFGLAFDVTLKQVFLEQELNANAMLYLGGDIANAQLNEKNFSNYAVSRYGKKAEFDFSPQALVYALSTQGVFCDISGDCHLLACSDLDAGRRELPSLDVSQVSCLIDTSSHYLAGQVKKNGQFFYGWHPCFDRIIPTYNTLRHVSSTYAMIEAWEVTGDKALKAAIDRSVSYFTRTLIKTYTLPDNQTLAYLTDTGDEIKLGGNAVCLLALVKYCEATGTRDYVPLLEQLALGIVSMQDAVSGRFDHVLNASDLSVKESFRIIYYDGEAAFGLMRLYGLTQDSRWLTAVENAFDYFIANKHWKAHDHWLSYCVNELTRYKPEQKYFRFGIQNVSGYLDFVLERITTYPTLLELMMASEQMLSRLNDMPDMQFLLQDLDSDQFYRALDYRAHYLLNGYFWPEIAMYFKNPERIAGSFFIRHHAFRVRIDDVEHYLSGFVAYRKYLQKQGRVFDTVKTPILTDDKAFELNVNNERPENTKLNFREGPNWTSDSLLKATQGHWLKAPLSDSWRATGLCIWAPTMQAGQMVVLRPQNGKSYLSVAALNRLPFFPQAVITSETENPIADKSIPVLHVADAGRAILNMGKFARTQMPGKIIGVTGSAGKTTTVAMLSHILRPWGEVGQTGHNANLPQGIAWNLASIPWSAPHAVIEMAIGQMQKNSELVQPDIAVITNIEAAHLEYHKSLPEIANKKSRIFLGMSEGGCAILNREMNEWAIVYEAARARNLRIISYGRQADSDVCLLNYDPDKRRVYAKVYDQEIHYEIGAPGHHMVMNSLACIASILALNLPLKPALAQFELFAPVSGRGVVHDLRIADKTVSVLDESYNANPASMQAAIHLAGEIQPPKANGRKIFVLGDMLELGVDSGKLHEQLLLPIVAVEPALVILCGNEMKSLFLILKKRIDTLWCENSGSLNAMVLNNIRDGDLILVKSSAGTGLTKTVSYLKACAEQKS